MKTEKNEFMSQLFIIIILLFARIGGGDMMYLY